MQYSKNNKDELTDIAREITKLLRDKYRNKDGVFIQGRVGEEIITNPIIDDFGDVAPFISLYGGEDMCRDHIFFIQKNINNLGFKRAFAYTDLILGLIWYSRIGEMKKESLELAIQLAEQVKDRWVRGGKTYSASYLGMTLPITNGIDSTFIEVWTELFRETGDSKYSSLATQAHQYFRSIHTEHKSKVIPLHYTDSPFGFFVKRFYADKFSNVNVMKDNTNYLFGLLDMIRLGVDVELAKDSFDTVHQVLSYHAKNNSLNNSLTKDVYSDLLSSFSFIDLSCDAYKLIGEVKYLEPAKQLAEYWLSLPVSVTKLFPNNYNSQVSYFDSETDMAIALLKLHECTNDIRYHDKAIELLNGILKFHKKENGFILQVNINDGLVMSESIKTKFVALFIKLLHLVSEGGSIYKDETLFMLAKDR
ncbi:hypothetical protein H6784_02480 [Candidatus Nomurabacteria bacterium]|nr:hypothetical protein [Candidatus Nomurabacteria bacterium]